MKLILGFDGWTAGYQHFERLVPEFNRQGYKLILIHIGSWGHDKNRPTEEMIGNLHVRDISYYGGSSISEILDIEKPSLILFMSTRALAHMAFNRYARHKNIPTCHMYHGLVMVQAFGKGESGYKINYIQHLFLFISRFAKNLFTIIPFYVRSVLETPHSKKDWGKFLEVLIRRGAGVLNKTEPFIIDTGTDIGCVYTAADVDHMNRNYQIPLNKIYVVGNPDIINFGLSAQDIGFGLSSTVDSSTLLYVDTALVMAGVVFNSVSDFIEHLLVTRDELEILGFDFIVKLHPAHYRTETPRILIENGIKLCTNADFIKQVKNSLAVIVQPSSAAVIPALLGVPVLLGQFGKLRQQSYGIVLSSYPRSRYLTNLSHVRTLLSDELHNLSINSVMDWIEVNRGPMPAEEMPIRAVNVMINLISQKSYIFSK
jgi:hypothetical protein